jgi:hypothetical protein
MYRMPLTPFPIPITNFNYPVGAIMSATAEKVSCAKPKEPTAPEPHPENTLDILKLVNVGKEVLNVQSFLQEHPSLLKNPGTLASEIKKARKNGLSVEFANGRINIPEDLFKDIVASAKNVALQLQAKNTYKIFKFS